MTDAASADLSEVEIRLPEVMSAEAQELSAGSEAELASLHAPEHRCAFSPERLASAQVHFVVAWQGGRPLACGGFAA